MFLILMEIRLFKCLQFPHVPNPSSQNPIEMTRSWLVNLLSQFVADCTCPMNARSFRLGQVPIPIVFDCVIAVSDFLIWSNTGNLVRWRCPRTMHLKSRKAMTLQLFAFANDIWRVNDKSGNQEQRLAITSVGCCQVLQMLEIWYD